MPKLGLPLSNFFGSLSKKTKARPVASHVGHSAPAPGANRDPIAECRRIAKGPLDDDAVGRQVAEYWKTLAAYNYEKAWRPRLEVILQVIEEGEICLPRVLAEVLRRVEKQRNEGLQPASYVAFGKAAELPQVGGGYLHRGAVVRSVAELCTPVTQSILEMGSGWGEHLCNLWLAGGPAGARYYACELSEHGRKCALVLAALEEGLQLEAPCFNYVAPDFGFLPQGQKEAVVYSVHSVEQVKEVAPDLIHRLCGLADVVKGVHFEPIGWQMVARSDWNEVTARHAERCREHRYNENFWQLLKQAEAEGLIQIDTAVPNFFGLEYNPASYIVWHKR